MKQRLTELHETVVAALSEADALSELGVGRDVPLAMSDVGIGLDRARLALETLVWPDAPSAFSFMDGS